MPWSAQIVEKNKSDGNAQVTILYTSGSESFRKTYTLANAQGFNFLKTAIITELGRLNVVDNLYGSVVIGTSI